MLYYGALFAFGLLSGVVSLKLWRRFRSRSEDEYHFLREDNTKCQVCFNEKKAHLCNLPTCSYDLFMKVITMINNAKDSLDVCNPCIEIEKFGAAILAAYKRDVTVRVIAGELTHPPRITLAIMAEGVRVKGLNPHNMMMHNKFIVIDQRILLRGSLNWTRQSLQGNYENFQVLRNQKQVAWYQQYFDNMWDDEHPGHATPELLERLRRYNYT